MLSTKKILIVDDDEGIVELMQEVISFDYEQSDTAQTVEKGIELVDTNLYDCIIVDLNINNVNGAVLIKHIKESLINKDVPIIIISGIVDPQFIEKHNGEYHAILSKPFELHALSELIKSATSLED
jgi:DNA-binding NtrC family response regulator